ncbi:PEPxxWA-CTERM sorting domain-containing protein (plasmid) [Polymorphobacter sp. PAMC 29334]|nr:PEPxxWA-CTERM sorting domain-containing protein [Polymorphobacter sp. PAMC 29334]
MRFGLAVLLTVAAPAFADIITITPPNPPSGQSQSPAPFTYRGTTGSRDQQVYSSSFFSGPQSLTSLAFRSTPSFLNGADYANVIINLSTTTHGDELGTPLSTVFADNIGSDVTNIYSGPLSFAAPTDQGFDYVINFTKPFRYNPAAGNLLLDVLIPAGTSVSGQGFFLASFDTANQPNDGVASVSDIFDGNATRGSIDTSGSITKFTGTAIAGTVPEPASWAMMVAGFGLVGVAVRRRPFIRFA